MIPLALALLACNGEPSTDSTPPDPSSPGDSEGADSAPTDSAPADDRMNLLLIVVDTLRADHLGLYGYDARPTSPNLDAWAEDAVVFDAFTAQSFWTVPVMSSMFTGVDPVAHGCCVLEFLAESEDESVLPDAFNTLPELFADNGYATAGLSKNRIYDHTTGISQGFQEFRVMTTDAAYSGESAGELTSEAMGWLQEPPSGPWFLYLHYMDPHSEYLAPEGWHDTWAGAYDSQLAGDDETLGQLTAGTLAWSEDDRARLMALYDEEIAYLDEQLQRVFEHLEASGLAERTVVVVAGDHGELFGEHGNWAHNELFRGAVHVPLAIRAPGLTPRRVAARTQTLDLTPTIARLFDMEPDPSWQGRDLTPALRSGVDPEPVPIFSAYSARFALTRDDLKLMYWAQPDRYELYDLASDPQEESDLYASHPDADALTAELTKRRADSAALGEAITGAR